MGDRATVQLVDNRGEYSPILYAHWAGDRVPDILKTAAPLMRAGDISYAFARMVGVFHNETDPKQGLSLGVYEASGVQGCDDQGDNGHFEVNVDTGNVKRFGGYTGDMGDLTLGRF